MSTYIIELQKFSITQGRIEKKNIDGVLKYSDADYLVCKKNNDGVTAAIKYASQNGYNHVQIPKGVYSFCYELNSDNRSRPCILIQEDNLVFDLNNSVFEVIFDSLNKSPYHKIDVEPWKLYGNLISIDSCINTKVVNGKLRGDIFCRSYTVDGEKWHEQTYGCCCGAASINSGAENLIIEGFTGSGFTGSGYYTQDKDYIPRFRISNMVAKPGILSISGIVTPNKTDAITWSYVTDLIPIDISKFYPSRLFDKKHPYVNVLQSSHNSGYTRIPNYNTIMLDVFFYDTSKSVEKPTRTLKIAYLDDIIFNEGENAIRLQTHNEAPNLDQLTTLKWGITSKEASFCFLKNCEVRHNHRGGSEPVGDNCEYSKCVFYNNGGDSGIGVPLFPDTTRYAINCEDTVVKGLLIKDCEFIRGQGLNCILAGCVSANIYNNTFSYFDKQPAVIIYGCLNATIKNNIMNETLPLTIMGWAEFKDGVRNSGSEYSRRVVIFEGNTILSTGELTLDIKDRANVKITNNVLRLANVVITNSTEENSSAVLSSNTIELLNSSGSRSVFSKININENKFISLDYIYKKLKRGDVEFLDTNLTNNNFKDFNVIRITGSTRSILNIYDVQMLVFEKTSAGVHINGDSIYTARLGLYFNNIMRQIVFKNCTIKGKIKYEISATDNTRLIEVSGVTDQVVCFDSCIFDIPESFTSLYIYTYNLLGNLKRIIKDCSSITAFNNF